jgi:hypothetical protein
VTPEQSIEARRLLGWTTLALAQAAALTLPAVVAFEDGSPTSADVILSIQETLEAAGAEFIPENAGSAGVRLRK